MNNKGFTLVELLGVIIILSLLMLIVLPKITNSTRGSSSRTDKLTEDLIYKATSLYLSENEGTYIALDGANYCIALSELVSKDYLKSPIKFSDNNDVTNSKVVEANYNNGYTYKLKDNNSCIGNSLYVESILNGSNPKLIKGLTPVKYDNGSWKVTSVFEKWYDYSKQEWANAVILNSGVKKNIGDTVDVASEVKAMLVWIPRYEYKIEGTYGKGGTSSSAPGEIEVNFISRTQTTASIGYRIHPAFKFGDKELEGIWVGKFETTGTESTPTILPNKESLRGQTVSKEFETAQKFNTYISGDSHMAKNSEWGAVAYLSQSKYGKYGNTNYTGSEKKVRINNCSTFITGVGANSQSEAESTTTCTTNTYNTSKGQTASTTGNITGIYDMSGGAWEYVMGVYRGSGTGSTWGASSSSNYADFTSAPNSKYYEVYTSTNLTTACNSGVCYGQALSETNEWYGGYARFVDSENPWLLRGGMKVNVDKASLFSIIQYNGNLSVNFSFRVVIAP